MGLTESSTEIVRLMNEREGRFLWPFHVERKQDVEGGDAFGMLETVAGKEQAADREHHLQSSFAMRNQPLTAWGQLNRD